MQLNRSFVNDLVSNVNPPFGPLGWFVYKKSYARPKGRRLEHLPETLVRCVEALLTMKGSDLLPPEFDPDYFFEMCYRFEGMISGRALWQLGTKTVKKIGGASLNNCWLVYVDHLRAFSFALDKFMLGGGVGFNISREAIRHLPKVKTGVHVKHNNSADADFIVPDSREGWVELVDRLVSAFLITGKSFDYSTILVRGPNLPIRGFGGTSSGPDPLILGIERLCNLFRSRAGRQLRSVDVMDAVTILGDIAISGNVRRTAILCAGDSDDIHFLNAKRWDLKDSSGNTKTVPPWRENSNNTIIANSYGDLPRDFFERLRYSGECVGLFNMGLARACGRVGDTEFPDPGVNGVNPCAEITLSAPVGTGEGEACNLAEVVLPNISSENEFHRVLFHLYHYCKIISSQTYHDEHTNQIISKNKRIGISLTGITRAMAKHSKSSMARWLNSGYDLLRTLDRDTKFGPSIKLTCVQPSGSKSKMFGVSSGIHCDYDKFYVQRLRYAPNNPVVEIFRNHGYPVLDALRIDGSVNEGLVVVEFPMTAGNAIVNLSAVQQLELHKFMNENWSDNSTSQTVYYKDEEIPEIDAWMQEYYEGNIKTISFLKHSGHGFLQAPLESINESEYQARLGKLKAIPYDTDLPSNLPDDDDDLECATGSCPRR